MLPASSRARAISRVALGIAFLVAATRAEAATLLDPSFRFRTLSTEHFLIYFHQGEDRLAVRLAAIAEDVWPRVGQALGIAAPRRTHVVLADQSELANGWATPLPYDLIFVTAAVPAGSEFIGRTDDWLRLVFTHEFTHIVHLDRSQGWARLLRGIFGRTPVAFPNVWLPVWQIEGIAEWEESALTGEGRRHAGDFRAIEREAARSGRLEPLDRVNGGLTDWPAGLAPYAFGLGFHEYLADRFGESRFGDLAARTSRSLPFFGSRAFRRVYGESLGHLWRDYEKSLSARPASSTAVDQSNPSNPSNQPNPSNLPNPIRLTHHGHTVLGPRFAPAACASCPAEIIYTVRNPDGFPALDAIAVDGSRSRQLATRYLGSTVGIGQDSIVFDQQEFHRNVGMYSDLYALDRRTGTVRALTHDQRLQDPDLSPAGESIVCVRENNGRRDLVLVRLGAERHDTAVVPGLRRTVGEILILISEADTQFNAPRWSPDGRSIAVERHRLGAQSEIVVVDVATRTQQVVASTPSSRIVTPAWRPDGRAIVAAADFGGDTFNLYEFGLSIPASAPRPLTHTSGGALWPDVSKDGELIAFAGYTPDGFDLFTTPYRAVDGSRIAEDLATSVSMAGTIVTSAPTTLPSRPYSPWATLPPTSWAPLVETGQQVRAGATAGGVDALGRHGYSASVSWLVSAPDGALLPSADVPDWHVGYAYDRWRPTFFVSASSDTLFGAGRPDSKGRPTPATLREHEVQAGAFLPFRRVRSSQRAVLSLVRTDDRYSSSSGTALTHRIASRVGVAANTAQLYGYSVSPEHGVTLGATAELSRRSLGSSADVATVTADGRGYLAGLGSHHVWAIRAAAGSSSGTAESDRTFLLGGAAPAVDVLDFGREAISLLRGFPPQAFAGTHAAVVNTDYRWPIARPQRGVGTWPIFLNTVHAALFVDVGQAWTDRFRGAELKTSAGAELSVAAVAGYFFPLTATLGAAWGHDGADRTDRSTLYIRVGRAF